MTFSVRAWLNSVGFPQYADLFEAQEIDRDVLPELTNEHLVELGIPVGPRVKLLKAIQQALDNDQAFTAVDGSAHSVTPEESSELHAERRQLTVMFVDLVGSTALASKLDPEDLRNVIRSYQKVVADEVARYEGHLAQYLGDGALAYFGYPTAHEDDGERAVYTALSILRKVSTIKLSSGEPLSIRIGIATGLVVVGELLGAGDSREHSAVGETPNLAARLQGIAEPGQAVISAATRDLLGELFELEDLGPHTLKGVDSPVQAYALLGERILTSRFDARTGGLVGDLIGRDGELVLLLERWRTTVEGEGQAAVIIGDAGIGKSRLVRAMQDELGKDDYIRISYQCSAHHTTTPLWPVTQNLIRATGYSAEDSNETKLDRLESLLGLNPGKDRKQLAVVATLLGIDNEARYGAIDLTPEQHRQRILDVLLNQTATLAQKQPVLLTLEDAHWIDPTSLELVELLAEQLFDMRAMLVVTSRPTKNLILQQRSDVGHVMLSRLARGQIANVVKGVTGGRELPARLLDEIAQKADGVPLFAEELTRTMLESDVLTESNGALQLASNQTLHVPASLHDSLIARLDRLDSAKDVAQIAACIGREFDFKLLSRVVQLDNDELELALVKLLSASLITARGRAPGATYRFRHALMRDAAYESLLKSRRVEIHTLLLAALNDTKGTPAEVLAQHAQNAGQRETAINCWMLASQQALERPAFSETITHLKEAMSLVKQMDPSPQWIGKQLQILLLMGQASIPLRGYGHADTTSYFAQANAIAEKIPDLPHAFTIAYALWVARYIRSEQAAAIEIATDMVATAKRSDNEGHLITGLRTLAISHMITGAPTEAEKCFAEALTREQQLPPVSLEKRVALAHRFAAEPGIATEFHHGFTLWSLGRISEARERSASALADARAMKHPATLSHALAHAAIFLVLSRDIPGALDVSQETFDYANRHELEMWKGYGALLNGYARVLDGDTAMAVPLMDRGFRYMHATQTGTMVNFLHAVQAYALGREDRFDEAEEHVAIVTQEIESGSEAYFWPEGQRLLGDYYALKLGADNANVIAAYESALAMAQSQNALTFALYAALSAARWHHTYGDSNQGREILTPVFANFLDTSQFPARLEAEELLAQLG